MSTTSPKPGPHPTAIIHKAMTTDKVMHTFIFDESCTFHGITKEQALAHILGSTKNNPTATIGTYKIEINGMTYNSFHKFTGKNYHDVLNAILLECGDENALVRAACEYYNEDYPSEDKFATHLAGAVNLIMSDIADMLSEEKYEGQYLSHLKDWLQTH